MRKILLAGAAALAVAVGFGGAANAQCMWNGFGWSCSPAPAYYYPPVYPYGSTYPSYDQPDYGWGYKPNWTPSIAGPRPSSGAGH